MINNKEISNHATYLKGLSWTLSVVFHPVFLFSWLTLIFISYAPQLLSPVSMSGLPNLLLVVFISTGLMPVLILSTLFIFLNKKVGLKGLFMKSKDERLIPFFFMSVYYSSLGLVLFKDLSPVLFLTLFLTGALILLVACISIFWKVSAHASGMGSIIGILLSINWLYGESDFLIPVLIIVIVSGLVLSSRLYLKAHNSGQVYVGFIIGLLFSIISIIIYYYLN